MSNQQASSEPNPAESDPAESDPAESDAPRNRAERRAQRRGKKPPDASGGRAQPPGPPERVLVPRRAGRRGNR